VPGDDELEQHRAAERDVQARGVDERLARAVVGEQQQEVLGDEHGSTTRSP